MHHPETTRHLDKFWQDRLASLFNVVASIVLCFVLRRWNVEFQVKVTLLQISHELQWLLFSSEAELDNFTPPCALRLHFTVTPTICWVSCRSTVSLLAFYLNISSVSFAPLSRLWFLCHQNHTSGRCSPSVSHPLVVNVVRSHTGLCMGFLNAAWLVENAR